MNLRKATSADSTAMFDVWLESTRATHDFVTAEHLDEMIPKVREYLTKTDREFWVLADDLRLWGFMSLYGENMEALFLHPAIHRQGHGRRLVAHARALCPRLTTDVNEQNAAALAFYQSCGFVVLSRSETDDQGRPYPLLHLGLAAPSEGTCYSSGNTMGDNLT